MTDTFAFENQYLAGVEYPDNALSVKMGKAYQFDSAPDAPPQRTFVIQLSGMRMYFTSGVPNATDNVNYNIIKLKQFYEANGTWKSFYWFFPWENVTLLVKFAEPLKLSALMVGGSALVETFEVRFLEQP